MIINKETVINDIYISGDNIFICFEGPDKTEAWLENQNKHCPDIYYISSDISYKIILNIPDLCDYFGRFPGQIFRLSLCNSEKRINYKVCGNIGCVRTGCFMITSEKECVIFRNIIQYTEKKISTEHKLEINHINKSVFENINTLPVDIMNIGTCFSRSIFRSDEYFNPEYKRYFNVVKTIFHNSFISLFSEKIKYDYLQIDDLITGDAGRYAGIEFEKNIKNIIEDNYVKLIIVDNYIDATTPVIKYNDTSYLTYNKYLSESVFKRFFSLCEVIYPGTEKHLDLYRKSIIAFNKLLKQYNIKNVVLTGGRLSRFKIDEKTKKTDIWDNKMEWIVSTNENWDKADKIFLEEIPDAVYLDMRKTTWKSDVYSPIIGGASPSHYQSGYYKELSNKLIQFLRKDLLDG